MDKIVILLGLAGMICLAPAMVAVILNLMTVAIVFVVLTCICIVSATITAFIIMLLD